MVHSSAKKKKSSARVRFHVAPQAKRKANDHQYVQYSVIPGGKDRVSKISASSSAIRTGGTEGLSSTSTHQAPVTLDDFDSIQGAEVENESDEIPVDAAYLKYLDSQKVEEDKGLNMTGDESLHEFVPQANHYLEEMIGIDGRGELSSNICPTCQNEEVEAVYECKDCLGRELYCSDCLVSAHSQHYLHRIQKWNGTFFERTTLKDLGLRVQLGHKAGEKCLRPEHVRSDDFVVVHIDAIHEISLDFCGCGNVSQQRTTQLLRARLFPATVDYPKTAATFRAMEYLEILSYESKLSVFEFFQMSSRCTDNTGTVPVRDRYRAILRMIHEWRYLKMMKRSGRGHSIGLIDGTQEGECAVLCPACPQPGKNMRPDWNTDESPKYLHTLFVALDANFRLKRKNVSSDKADPGLHHGCAYFVEEVKYKQHLGDHINEKEPKSTCSRHDAINLSEKSAQGHSATGIGACVCSRHDMKRPVAVGDLQRGERYCNMDYLFHSTMKNAVNDLEHFVVSYDIACQWSINLRDRMDNFQPALFVHDGNTYVRFLVPKFHLPAHISKCRAEYSFNFASGTGRTDGEAPERGWVDINGLATSTREMGPGTRRDTLDCHMGDENWKKVTGMGASFYRKMKAAAKDMAEYGIAYDEMSSTVPEDTRIKWENEVTIWEDDKAAPNPYEVTSAGPTQAAVLRQLAEDEALDIQNSRDMSLDDKITPSVLISLGMDLENEQRRLRTSTKGIWSHSLDRQRTKLQYQLNTLQRKIDAWISYQNLYIPGLVKLRKSFEGQTTDSSIEIKPFDVALWLPSQINGIIDVPAHLQRIEWKLRYSQAHEALELVRTQLQVRAHMFKHKYRFIRGQHANTRARNTINGTNVKIQAAADQYNNAYQALTTLSASMFEAEWNSELLPLRPEDIRDLSEGRETHRGRQSEGRRTASWIWRKVAIETDDHTEESFMTDRFRAEWARSRARSLRFSEEVSLLSEEMGRVLAFFEYKALRWEALGHKDNIPPNTRYPVHEEGRRAYAKRQAHMYRQMRTHFQQTWKSLPEHVMRMCAIREDPSLAEPGEFDPPPQSKSKYNNRRTVATV